MDPPWGGKYTININTEMNYWPAEATNLAECVEPLVRMLSELAETGARTAQVSGTACSVRYGQRRIELTLAPGQTKNITARELKEL